MDDVGRVERKKEERRFCTPSIWRRMTQPFNGANGSIRSKPAGSGENLPRNQHFYHLINTALVFVLKRLLSNQ